MGETLLVAQLDAAEVQNAVLHGSRHALALAGPGSLVECADDPERKVEPGPAVADLRAGDEGDAVTEAGGGRRAAGALRDILIDLAVFVRSRPEPFDRGHDHLRVDAMDLLPGKAHAVEHTGAEILHQHVAFP